MLLNNLYLHTTLCEKLTIKRKCKASPGGSVKKWWFVIKRNELYAELLEELLKISIQTVLLHTVHEWFHGCGCSGNEKTQRKYMPWCTILLFINYVISI